MVQQYGVDNWGEVAKFFPERSDIQLQNRWYKVLDPKIVKGPWTKEEDDQVLKLMEQFANRPKKWADIANELEGRTAKQCRER